MSRPATVNPWTTPKSPNKTKKPKPAGTVPAASNGHGSDYTAAAASLDDGESTAKQEIEVLQAIYMEDFEDHHESHTAWGTVEHSVRIRLKADTDPAVSLLMVCKLPATYPKSAPQLHVEQIKGIRQQTVKKVEEIARTRPQQLVGSEMIHEIAASIQDELNQDADLQAQRGIVPSLEEERAETEAAAAKAAEAREAEVRKQQEAQKAEEGILMQRMVDEELKRRVDTKKRRTLTNSDVAVDVGSPLGTILTLDQSVQMLTRDGLDLSFRSISVLEQIGEGSCTRVMAAYPLQQAVTPVCLAVKQARALKCKVKKTILDLEDELEKLKRLHHPNAINLLDFKIVNGDHDEWNFDILVEYATGKSLLEILAVADMIPAHRSRSFSIEILTALDFYHKNGVVHGRLHLGNVFLVTQPNGIQVIKLADAAFQEGLRSIKENSHTLDETSEELHPAWRAPELAESGSNTKTRKTDVWSFGTCLVEMIFGLKVFEQFQSPQSFLNGAGLSEPFEDLLREVLRMDPKRRPTAFEIIPYEFLRTDAPPMTPVDAKQASLPNSTAGHGAHANKLGRNESSQVIGSTASRYHNEWDEAGRLGRGGYGEVVKARNKLDARTYAIKKITQKTPSEMSQVLSEVHLLGTLNHPYVVRYFTAWAEEETAAADAQDGDIETSSELLTADESEMTSSFMNQSSVGLDFISSSGYPRIEFGHDSTDDGDDSDEEDDDTTSDLGPHGASTSTSGAGLGLRRTRSASRAVVKSTLYIQMEFCERLTLRDMIRRNIHENPEEVWRLLRQILEGLVHIHSHGIIHRDLKPENIFIDASNNPKIGDFGLATTSQYYQADRTSGPNGTCAAEDMTKSVGTTLYVAPELKSTGSGHYTDKVDMYSLGIIFFEMCHPLHTAMERMHTVMAIRQKDHTLPPEFDTGDQRVQGEIILSLIKHRPSERPSSAELLRSGKLPVQIQDEAIKLALQGLSDANSPHFQKIMSSLFSHNAAGIKDHMWDLSGDSIAAQTASDWMIMQSLVRDCVVACFRRHGAVETKRQALLPLSDYYANQKVVRLLDPSGVIVQLPYDLTMPHARAIARQLTVPQKSFVLGTVFRADEKGGAPISSREADFDIVFDDEKHGAMKEAEVIKVMDEVLDNLPSYKKTSMCYHVNHSGLLDIILDCCRVTPQQRFAAKDILSRLNTQGFTFTKLRTDLRAPPANISSTSLDDLALFDFRDTIEKCHGRLKALLKDSPHQAKLQVLYKHVLDFGLALKRFRVKRPVYWSPLSCFNDKFYRDAVMFQCLYDTKKRDVLAAGGRYDQLIEGLKPKFGTTAGNRPCHAVGLSIAWNRLITHMFRYTVKPAGSSFLKKGDGNTPPANWVPRRCDALVASFDAHVLYTRGVEVLATLWDSDYSAELAPEAFSSEALMNHYKDDRHSWIIIIKHDETNSGKPDLRIKNLEQKEDADVHSSNLLSWLRSAVRERDANAQTSTAKLMRHTSQPEETLVQKKAPVQVLPAGHKSKKGNNLRFRVVEAAQARAAELADSFKESPIASIEISDAVLDLIRETRLSDSESWRRIMQSVPLADRQYLNEVHHLLLTYREQAAEHTGNCFVYNFRSGAMIYYDLRL